ncbi:hypothetical protein B0H21DRAFT_827257 [Amylocystis lapponica]|nr:hypothetical protein B0H21DRAFT_827257 [Amylocystis lapponica]
MVAEQAAFLMYKHMSHLKALGLPSNALSPDLAFEALAVLALTSASAVLHTPRPGAPQGDVAQRDAEQVRAPAAAVGLDTRLSLAAFVHALRNKVPTHVLSLSPSWVHHLSSTLNRPPQEKAAPREMERQRLLRFYHSSRGLRPSRARASPGPSMTARLVLQVSLSPVKPSPSPGFQAKPGRAHH